MWSTPSAGGMGPAPASSPTSGYAIAALVFGILGGIPLAVTFGIVALRRTARTGQRGRGVAIAGLTLAGCWAALIGWAFAADIAEGPDAARSVLLAHLAVGDCIEELPAGSEVRSLPRVACDGPHAGQVYAAFDLPDGAWPGDEAVFASAERGCSDELQREHPAMFADPAVGVFFLHPIASGWRRGDREVLCVTDYGAERRTGDMRVATA